MADTHSHTHSQFQSRLFLNGYLIYGQIGSGNNGTDLTYDLNSHCNGFKGKDNAKKFLGGPLA